MLGKFKVKIIKEIMAPKETNDEWAQRRYWNQKEIKKDTQTMHAKHRLELDFTQQSRTEIQLTNVRKKHKP